MSSSYYFKGDCNKKEVKEQLKDKYISILSDPRSFPPTFCTFNKDCKLANIQVYCGSTNAVRRRRRRGTQMEVMNQFMVLFKLRLDVHTVTFPSVSKMSSFPILSV